jgi:hypothetical protein
MKLSEIHSLLGQLRKRPIRTLAVLFAIVISLTLLAWITTLAQEKAKQWVNPTTIPLVANSPIKATYTLIDLTKNGFIGLRDDISPIEAIQRFGFPKYSPTLLNVEYPTFAMGFNEDGKLMNIRFDWLSDSRWKTTSGLEFGGRKADVLRIFGEPERATLEPNCTFYYDRFAVDFDKDGKVYSVILYIRDSGGLTFAELERETLELMIKRPELVQKLGADKDPNIMITLAAYNSLLRRQVLSAESRKWLETIKTEHPEWIRLLEESEPNR